MKTDSGCNAMTQLTEDVTAMTDRSKTHPDTLFLTDNGACYCGEHLGSSARFTGRDISGQEIVPVCQRDVAEFASWGLKPTCERCGKGMPRIEISRQEISDLEVLHGRICASPNAQTIIIPNPTRGL